MSSRLILIITVIQLFTYSVLLGFDANAQMDAVINKDLKSKSVKQILKIIEKETEYNFIYDGGKTNVDRNISIAGNSNTVKDILDALKSELNLSFKVINKTITVIQPLSAEVLPSAIEKVSDGSDKQKSQDLIKGKITDKAAGEPLIGVSIKLKGSSTGTTTDINGEFSLTGPNDAVLVITYIGYQTREIQIGGRAFITESLEASNSQLNEVVVLGYQTATKRSVTTSVASVSAKEIKSYVTGNVANALQGKIAGVQISPGSGLPGSQPTIMIRGLSSLTGNTTPLVIVDGNEIGYNSLNFINPSDIETFDVLKDASAAAIYGSRGGQGVILITTKRGKGKPTINFESSFGFDNVPNPGIADAAEYVRVMNKIATNSGVAPYFPNPESVQGTDYWDRTFDQGVRQNYNISATGGKEGLSLYGSLGYYKQDSYNATDKGGNWEKVTARFNADLDLGKIFKMGLSFAPRYEKWLNSPNNTWAAFSMDPTTAPLKTQEEVYASIPNGFMDFTAFNPIYSLPNRSAFANINNPEFNYITNFNQNEAFGAQYGTYLQATPIKNLVIKTSLEGFATSTSETDYLPKYYLATNATRQVASVSGNTQTNMRWKFTNTANYKFDIQKHHIDVLAGFSADSYTVKGTSASRDDIPFDLEEYRYLASATGVSLGNGYYQKGAAPFGKMISYFGSLRYNFRDKYYLSGSMRADASSLVNPDYHWGYFPTLSAAWMISDEPFFEPIASVINSLKLRASWGRAGGNLPDRVGAYISTVSPINYPDANGGVVTGYYPSVIANPEIKWEVQEDYTVGLDAELFRSKLNVTLEAYVRNPQNLLVEVMVDPALGYPQDYIPKQPTNIGKLTTKGWDAALNYRTNFSKKLRFGADLTLSHFKSIADYAGNADPVRYGVNNDVISTFRSRLTKGHEPGAWYGYVSDGVFQTDAQAVSYVNAKGERLQPLAKAGDLIFRDVNGDGKIDNDDLTDIGSPWPKLNTGLTLTLGYGNFDFRTEFYSAIGHQYNNGYRLQMSPTNHYNFISGFADQFWSGEGSSNEFPILRFPDPNGNFSKMSTFMIEDADFLRCRLLQIGYTIPATLVKGIKNIRVYASTQNLFTISKYSGLNPDLPFQGIGLNGIDNFQAMQPRTYLFGLSLAL